MEPKILVIEDELSLAKFLAIELRSVGYAVTICGDGMSGLIEARTLNPDLVLLDWMLPYISGPEICRRLRQTGSKVPIILLTARDCIEDRVTGLDSGADDYLTKPFKIEELLARVRVRFRGLLDQQRQILRYSNLMLKQLSREAYRDGQRIKLTAKEFDLLVYFLQNPQTALRRHQILEHVWQDNTNKNDNLVDVYISHLRSKLEQHNPKRLIHTVRGCGYVLR